MIDPYKRALDIIENYNPCRDMKTLPELIKIVMDNPNTPYANPDYWRNLPPKVVIEIASLCVKEDNDFYRRT